MMAHPPHVDSNAYDLAEPDQTHQSDPEPAGDDQTYALSEVVKEPPRQDLKELSEPARWCLACGCDLTLIDTGVCPQCEKKFDPANPATFSPEPPRELGNWWLQPPRLAGYVLIPLFTVGRIIINTAAPAVGKGLQGEFGGSQLSNAAGAVISAIGVLSLIPWIMACVLLVLTGIREYFAPKIPLTIGLGAGFGMLFMLSLHPAIAFVGLVGGGLAGFVYAWRSI